MNPDILIVQVHDGYRVLHGHLHLINALNMSDEVLVEAKDQGKLMVKKSGNGMFVERDNSHFPLLQC